MKLPYIDSASLLPHLTAGRPVEQWLGGTTRDGHAIIRWLRIDRERNGTFSTTLFEALDDGRGDFHDVYAFSPWDVDSPEGHSTRFADAEAAVRFACETLGAKPDLFVPNGRVQDAYAAWRESGRKVS